MKQVFQQLQRLALYAALCLLAAAPASALASPAGPNGINIGIDFNWNQAGPPGYAASFINTSTNSGATLINCTIGPTTPTSNSCDFPIAYSIGGTPQTAVVSGGAYNTWAQTAPSNARFCDLSVDGITPNNTAPLTLWNCFNQDSFGQIFKASATGTLSGMTLPMTCLNPAGGTLPPGKFFAVIYQVNAGGNSIPATPLAQVPVDLATCPTLTSWDGHTFSAGDFAEIPLNFSNVTLTSGKLYAVYFAGPDVPGAQLPGFTPPPPAPTLTVWGAIALAATLLAFGMWKLRRRSAA
jgi:hypothetical protein